MEKRCVVDPPSGGVVRPALFPKVLIAASLTVVVVILIDTAIAEEWDVFVVALILGLLQLGLWAQLESHRPAVPIRADLVRWLKERARLTDEAPGHLADRAIAAYRAGLIGDTAEEAAVEER